MKQLNRFYYLGGSLLFAGGCLTGYTGCMQMFEWVKNASENEIMTTGQFARGLVLPHIMILFGLGGSMFGLILVARCLMLRKRISGME